MKTYEEMAQSALERIGAYEAKRNERKKITRIAVPTVCACLVALLGVGLWWSGAFSRRAPIADPEAPGEAITTAQPTATAPTEPTQAPCKTEIGGTVKPTAPQSQKGPAGSDNGFAMFWWRRKLNVGGQLYWALERDPSGTFTVAATYRPTTADITDFTYGGETLAALAVAADNESLLPEKMAELLKCGDELKYGAALYTTGTPSGVTWSKELYDETVAYFGADLLNKYIVNGEFRKEALQADLAVFDDTARAKYKRAFAAYMDDFMPRQIARLTANGIRCERAGYANNVLTAVVTADELENLPLDNLKWWSFDESSASKSAAGGQPVDDMTAVN